MGCWRMGVDAQVSSGADGGEEPLGGKSGLGGQCTWTVVLVEGRYLIQPCKIGFRRGWAT